MIKDVKWNYDAGNYDMVFVHIMDEDDNRLTLEIERRRGHSLYRWIIRKRNDFMIKVT